MQHNSLVDFSVQNFYATIALHKLKKAKSGGKRVQTISILRGFFVAKIYNNNKIVVILSLVMID